MITLMQGDCIEAMRSMPDASVDAVVTDPPYGLGFMGKAWDALPPGEEWARECLRVLKPGGHLLAFGGTRTWHRLAVAVEDAGFELRDSIAWLYGSGFPKSLDVSKAIDKLDATDERRARALRFTAWMRSTGITARAVDEATGTNMGGHYLTDAAQPAVAVADLFDLLRPLLPDVPADIEELVAERTVESQNFAARAVVGERRTGLGTGRGSTSVIQDNTENRDVTAPHTDAARQWQGWGTALKPAFEPIVVGRKPLIGTVAANVLMHGTGALNIDGCRIGTDERLQGSTVRNDIRGGAFATGHRPNPGDIPAYTQAEGGRWPANVVLDPAAAAELDAQSGTVKGAVSNGRRAGNGAMFDPGEAEQRPGYADTGGASRFFFVPGRQGSTLGSCDPVSTAETTSSPPRPSVDSAPGDAATSARPGTSPASSTAPSTIGTASGSRPSAAPGTQEIPSTASECSPESPQPSSTPHAGPADHAVPIEPTGTTRITTSPSISSGSADDATSSATSRSAEAGAAGFPSFRYQAKAPRSERPVVNGLSHATVKPLTLMRWLVRLVTPPGGVVLEPFLGSGTTAQACELEGFDCIGIERDPDYLRLTLARLNKNGA